MSVLETIGIFVVIPVALYAVIALLTVVPARARRRSKYKVGQPWDYPPQWWSGDRPVTPAVVASTGREGGARGTW